MADYRTAAHVQTARPVSSTANEDQNGYAHPHLALLRFLSPPQDDSIEPPRKRQRVTREDTEDDARVDESSCIALDRVTVVLEFQDGLSPIGPQTTQLPIVVQSAESHANGTTSLTIRRDARKSPALKLLLRCDKDDLPAQLERIAQTSKDKNLSDVIYRRTILSLNDKGCITLSTTLFWRSSIQAIDLNRPKRLAIFALLRQYFPDDFCTAYEAWTPRDFYDHVHVPPAGLEVSPAIQSELLECQLYPFQKRAIDWMMRREGARLEGMTLKRIPEEEWDQAHLPAGLQEVKDAAGQRCFISHMHGAVVRDVDDITDSGNKLKGGILSEEMGLGKTCELIGLMCLNTRNVESGRDIVDEDTGATLKPTKATLIITPPSILQQWKNELALHAPTLKVLEYHGHSMVSVESAKKKKRREEELLEALQQYDVVVTTYNIIATEVHKVTPPPDRNLRHAPKHERPTSPLIRMHWHRVVLDEAQLVESGVTAAAIVARLIPRTYAWAVSGTPLRKDSKDLLGLLMFLHYEPYSHSAVLWDRLITEYKDIFKALIGQIALRHTKDKIRQEIRLPPQRRVVMTLPFSAVEEQNYAQLYQQMAEDCRLSLEGAPLDDDWDPEDPVTVKKMKDWLLRLRQTCLHPNIGGRNKRALGRGEGVLRTVAQVLEVMIDQNLALINSDERSLLLAIIRKAQIIGNDGSNEQRSRRALEIFEEALTTATVAVADARAHYTREFNEQQAKATTTKTETTDTDTDLDDTSDEKEKDKNSRLGQYRAALRNALQIQHTCLFFAATAYYQIKSDEKLTKPDSDEFKALEAKETELYDRAKQVRKEMLMDPSTKAERLMHRIQLRKADNAKDMQGKKQQRSFTIPEVPELADAGGIENRKILEKLDDLADRLNASASQIAEWREKVIEYLTKPLVDEDKEDEMTGEEYEASTKEQEYLYAYIDALRAITSDRSRMLSGQPDPLIDHEMKTLLVQAKEGEGHAPELMIELMDVRNKLKATDQDASMRAIVTEIRSLVTALEWQATGGSTRAAAELLIVQKQADRLKTVSSEQNKAQTGLEADLNLFRATMNQRLAFYKQLQVISDAVAPYKEELDEKLDQDALFKCVADEDKHSAKLATLKTKQRFLEHLRTDNSNDDTSRQCVICQSPFELGVLTVCGHQYCKECIRLWWSQHRNCPVCKRHLQNSDFHDITYKPKELQAVEESSPGTPERLSASPSSSTSNTNTPSTLSIYSEMNAQVLSEIKAIDLEGSYGTKIDTLARHLLWIRDHDPGAKSIIFSQYRSFLSVLAHAFAHFRIGYSSILPEHTSSNKADAIERFRRDASVETFLLDAKSDSSGLNLVNATYVFLCEPLVNTAIELQAVARVHRIGQQRQTSVFVYVVLESVEEAIYELGTRRRMEHLERKGKARLHPKSTSTAATSAAGSKQASGTSTPNLMEKENALEQADSLELQQVSLSKLMSTGRSGGENVDKEDLWKCLFGKKRAARGGVMDVEEVGGDLGREVERWRRGEAADGRRVL